MIGMSKEAYVESGSRVVAPAVEERCKYFGTIDIPSITIMLKADLMFRKILLLLYKFSGGKSEL